MSAQGHKHTSSMTQNHKAQLANAYNELGKELSSQKIRIIGNYTLGKVIGEGAYGKVRIGTHRLTSSRVAIKQIPKATSASLTREIHHHRQLHHPHITQMYEVIATESYIWIITELCSGGELFDYLAEKGRLSEDETRILFGQLCLAVAYLHDKGIVHRDLKLENVLLDERCRVKLGDFGFTREYERGVLMETFCGTTGYAAPEMLQGKRYLGPEVDIWSMGIILYCLLTGTLPFDDDNEVIMKEKVIKGEYTDPEWLSKDARGLIRNILQPDSTKRLTISQILSSPWFSSKHTNTQDEVVKTPVPDTPTLTVQPTTLAFLDGELLASSATTSTSEATFVSATSDLSPLSMRVDDATQSSFPVERSAHLHPNPSQRPDKKGDWIVRSTAEWVVPGPVLEDESEENESVLSAPSSVITARAPSHPARTPARTKRRSMSSSLSESGGLLDKPVAMFPPQDFASLLKSPTPIIFSTPAERELLNALSVLGFDTAQIVHSVLSDACDATGAIWWMLIRKHEKRILDEVRASEVSRAKVTNGSGSSQVMDEEISISRKRTKCGVAVQTDVPAPHFAVVPPTPTVDAGPRPSTPPRSKSPFLLSSPLAVDLSARSHPSTPTGGKGFESKDKDPFKLKRDTKVRSGSISIMQRATTALEAAGLVRKKSSEGVKEDREKTRDHEKRPLNDDPRSSHGSGGSAKLTKSPPVKAKEGLAMPPPHTLDSSAISGSPWVITGRRSASPQSSNPTPANSPGDTLTSLPNFNEDGSRVGPHRNRASILSTLRLWFNEDRKGKRKETMPLAQGTNRNLAYSRSLAGSSTVNITPAAKAPIKRRTSDSGRGRRVKRQSVSSRRSSSVNSRRSSAHSAQIFMLDQHLEQIPSARSFEVDTPNSERGDHSSQPSSVQSSSVKGKHRKSPSTGSNGSAYYRNTSSLPKYQHRRQGSSSSTRVVRHVPGASGQISRPQHHRSNSAASSVHSLTSSRPTSFYDVSEDESIRTSSPFKSYPSRHSEDVTPRRGAGTFIAQKRLTPFTSPHNSVSIGRTSWKKSWGNEPPGWQSRSTHLPVEVVVISPAPDIRDVFSSGGRQSFSMGDESDWVDDDDDVPEFAGGLGQMSGSSSTNTTLLLADKPTTMVAPPPPRGVSSRGGKTRGSGTPRGRSKYGSISSGRSSLATPQSEVTFEAMEARGGRWQLPARGSAFRHAIQEVDEEE